MNDPLARPATADLPAHRVGRDDSPAFSPDGHTLAFARLMAGGRDIYVVAVPGGKPTQLTSETPFRPIAGGFSTRKTDQSSSDIMLLEKFR